MNEFTEHDWRETLLKEACQLVQQQRTLIEMLTCEHLTRTQPKLSMRPASIFDLRPPTAGGDPACTAEGAIRYALSRHVLEGEAGPSLHHWIGIFLQDLRQCGCEVVFKGFYGKKEGEKKDQGEGG